MMNCGVTEHMAAEMSGEQKLKVIADTNNHLTITNLMNEIEKQSPIPKEM